MNFVFLVLTIFTAMFCQCKFVSAFVPEIQMPYKAIAGTSTAEINAIGSTLTCDEQKNSLQDCATECYDSGCPGFYTDTTQNNVCHLCHVSNITEINANSFTTFSNNDIVYLVKRQTLTPEIFMDFDDHTGITITGVGVVGTTIGVAESEYVEGKKNQGVYLGGGDKVRLTGSGTECWTNLEHCPSGMTVSIWYKPMVVKNCYIAASGSQYQIGFSMTMDTDKTRFWIESASESVRLHSDTVLSAGQWSLLTGSYDHNDGGKFYINGVLDYTNVTTNPSNILATDWRAHLGVKDHGSYDYHPADGAVDDFRYFYRVLNPVEVWREFIGYDLDLDLQPIITSPDDVSNGNNYADLIDGNLATCVVLTTGAECNPTMKVKLWNSAPDKKNYTVTVITENMDCDHPGLMVYGAQDLAADLAMGRAEEKLHFLGKKQMLKLKQMNTGNECLFHHLCDENPCYYVFLWVENTPDENLGKICEIQFN